MAMVNKIKKGNVEKDIHDTRIPELTGEEAFCVPFVNEDGDAFQIGSIPSACLDNGSVTTEKVANNAITKAKIDSNVASGIADHVVSMACKYIDGEFTDIVVAQDANTLLSWFTSADETVAACLFVDDEFGKTSFILPKVRVYNECGVGGTGTGEVDCDFVLVLPNGKTLLGVSFMADLTDGVFDGGDWSITIRNNQVKIGSDDISDNGIAPNNIRGTGSISPASQGDNIALFDTSTKRLKKSVAFDGNSNSVLHGDGSFYGKVAGAFNTSSDITVSSYVQEPSYPYEKEGELAQGSFSKLANSESPTIIDDGKVFTNTISYYHCVDSSSSVYTFESKDKRLTIHNNDTFELQSTVVYQHYVTAITDIGKFCFSVFNDTSGAVNRVRGDSGSPSDLFFDSTFWIWVVGTSVVNYLPTVDTPIPCTGWGYDSSTHTYFQFLDFYHHSNGDLYLTTLAHNNDTGKTSKQEKKVTLQSYSSLPCKFVR